MTFDTRVRRAVQGIHRAVEVKEMSSTKTPQKLTRFDQYREGKSRNKRIAALVVGIAVPLALLIGAVRLMESGGDSNVPAATPSESVTPTSVSGRSETFRSPFTYAVPSDWTFSGEGTRYFSLQTPGAFGTDVIVLSDVVAAAPDCSDQPAQGVGTSSEAMTSWLSAHPALDATGPRPVRMGVATGSYVDVRLAADWNQTCPNGLDLVTSQPNGKKGWSIGGGQRMRLYVLDLPSGGTVTVVIDPAQSPSGFQSLIAQAAPVVESFRFLK